MTTVAVVRGASLGLLLVGAGAGAVPHLLVNHPPNRPDRFYLVPSRYIPDPANGPAVRQKLEVPGSQWGPFSVTAQRSTDGHQWYIFAFCDHHVATPGKLIEETDHTADLICP